MKSKDHHRNNSKSSKSKKMMLADRKLFERDLLERVDYFQKADIHDLALKFTQKRSALKFKNTVLFIIKANSYSPSRESTRKIKEYISLHLELLLGDEGSNDLAGLDLKGIEKLFDEDRHLDWFEQVWEMWLPGSGPDLSALAAYGFIGYIYDNAHPYFLPWTFRDLFAENGRGNVSPKEYLKKLIKNCEYYLHPPDELFAQALLFAKARYQLDFEDEIDAYNFSVFCGRDVRTLANNGLLMPGEANKKPTILKEHAVNFLVNKRRPDGTKVKRDKVNNKIGAGTISPFPEIFYHSIWKEQIVHKTAVDIDFDGYLELCRLEDFKSDNVMGVEKYIKNIDKFPSNVAIHNKTRVEWIGKGKTFNEINAADSTYRKNVKRLNYAGNSSSIMRDLKYDLKKGWIKKINK